MEKKLYTLLVYSENIAGVLNQITAVFTRRQINIESLNVSASSIPDVHKYTITAWSDEEQIKKVTKQIEKKIDVVKADYYTDDDLFIHEVGLYKISTSVLLENPEVSRTMTTDMFIRLVRKYTRAKKLTPRMLNELVEKIEVFNAEKVNGVWEQRLRIHYNCVGTIEIPSALPLPTPDVSVNTRKGVVVNHAPCDIAI